MAVRYFSCALFRLCIIPALHYSGCTLFRLYIIPAVHYSNSTVNYPKTLIYIPAVIARPIPKSATFLHFKKVNISKTIFFFKQNCLLTINSKTKPHLKFSFSLRLPSTAAVSNVFQYQMLHCRRYHFNDTIFFIHLVGRKNYYLFYDDVAVSKE